MAEDFLSQACGELRFEGPTVDWENGKPPLSNWHGSQSRVEAKRIMFNQPTIFFSQQNFSDRIVDLVHTENW
jgi:hypothetical protein